MSLSANVSLPPGGSPPEAEPAAPPASLLFGSRRIGVRIFIGYLLPLLISLIAGLVVPLLVTSLLGRAIKDYAQAASFVDDAYALRRAARDSESDLRGFLLYDPNYREQFQGSRDDYRERFRRMETFVAAQNNQNLDAELSLADSAYRRWYTKFASPEFAAADRDFSTRSGAVAQSAVNRAATGFTGVKTALDRLVGAAETYREQQLQRANLSERWRVLSTWAIPVAAMLIAAVFARYFAVSITKPIEGLRLAAEEVERGDTTRLLTGDYPQDDDEIGDLGHALSRMARTIGEREAILRAQNAALAAIGRRIEAVLNATNDGIVLLDRAEGFSLVNERFAALFGINAEDVRDQTFTQAAPLFLDRFRNKAAASAQFGEWVANWETVADETMDIAAPMPRTLRVFSSPVRGEMHDNKSGDIIGRIFVFRDVTRETIVDRMKTEFVSTVSHELRTPLTAIKGYVDLMMTGKTGDLNPLQTEFLGMVQESTRRLTNLINDMLDVSRIESGRITVHQESVEYLSVVREAVRMMAGQADEKNIVLTLEPEVPAVPPVRGDRDRITQVLVNLLSNAIKYTPAGGNVRVMIEAEGGVLTTCVADNGIGISADDQNRLFQKFFRADNSTTREVGGTGLGLAITKAILERMAGTIRVESEPGAGSRFLFTLPLANTPAPAEEPVAAPVAAPPVTTVAAPPSPVVASGAATGAAASTARDLILLIEENPAILHRLTGLFRGIGYVTSGATTAADAVRRARNLHPDAVLINIAAKGFDAPALIHALRTGSETRRLPVFVCALVGSPTGIVGRDCVSVVAANAPPLADAAVLDAGDSADTIAAVLESAAGGDPATFALDIADFAAPNDRLESLALGLQSEIVSGTPLVLHLRDAGEPGAGGLLSLASPDAPHGSPETIAEEIGNYLRNRAVNIAG